MEDGRLKFQFVEGKVVGVYISADMGWCNERLFKQARRGLWRKSNSVEHGIRAILFGCFWLEAHCNELLGVLLSHALEGSRLENVLWKRIKRWRFSDKLEVLGAFADEVEASRLAVNGCNLKKVFELRDRIVHFKDEDQQITDSASTKEEIIRLFEESPDPPLICELKGKAVRHHASAIASCGRRMTRIYEQNMARAGLSESEAGALLRRNLSAVTSPTSQASSSEFESSRDTYLISAVSDQVSACEEHDTS